MSGDILEATNIWWAKAAGTARHPVVHRSPQQRMFWPSRSVGSWQSLVLCGSWGWLDVRGLKVGNDKVGNQLVATSRGRSWEQVGPYRKCTILQFYFENRF